jgi:ketosteroid isomerase-like protein
MQFPKKGTGPLDAWNRRTVILSLRDGIWKIVHEHSSCPTAMDGSLKSIADPDNPSPARYFFQ